MNAILRVINVTYRIAVLRKHRLKFWVIKLFRIKCALIQYFTIRRWLHLMVRLSILLCALKQHRTQLFKICKVNNIPANLIVTALPPRALPFVWKSLFNYQMIRNSWKMRALSRQSTPFAWRPTEQAWVILTSIIPWMRMVTSGSSRI